MTDKTPATPEWCAANPAAAAAEIARLRAALADRPFPEPLVFATGPDDALDEVMGTCDIHLERMDGHHWWLAVYRPGTSDRAAIDLRTDGAFIRAEVGERLPRNGPAS